VENFLIIHFFFSCFLLSREKIQNSRPVNYGPAIWISFTLPAALLEQKMIDRQDETGPETLPAPLLGLRPERSRAGLVGENSEHADRSE
jgi:hypothetical protein